MSKLFGIKVVISKQICKKDFFGHFENKFDVGPREFLNYIYYADFVITTSFHGCVFSSVFEKNFITVNAEKDNRRKNFLNDNYLMDRNIDSNINDEHLINVLSAVNYDNFRINIRNERKRSYEYLKRNIEG